MTTNPTEQDARTINSEQTLDPADVEAQLDGDKENVDEKQKLPTPNAPTTLATDDPENPRNWSTAKRTLVTIVLCVWVLTLTYSSTCYVRARLFFEAKFDSAR
ncbi:hypothetical protein R3P38DRAFT_2938612 [Favolaschia claudopus]|uniref:Uncharacterized protein n=1 Tax=Favolaschia claudopus TaxID=2862362 RepID=A0AAW0BMH7_9AGAR